VAAPLAVAGAAAGAKAGAGAKLGGFLKRQAIGAAVDSAFDRDAAQRFLTWLFGVIGAALFLVLLLVAVAVLAVTQFLQFLNPFDGAGAAVRVAGIPAVYWPMYQGAAEHYGVNPYLLASIHQQETGFSSHPSSGGGVNFAGCCAGPMQFNVRDGTWEAYKNGFRPIADQRPQDYPLSRAELPSCRAVPKDTGCVYDDFDAIAAAAQKLKADGADTSLYSEGTRQAVCSYIGACSELENCGGPNAYCQVLPRAREWELQGVTPVPSGRGEVVVSLGANRLGVPLRPEMTAFLETMANISRRKIVVTTGSDHSQFTTSGNVSDHWSGLGADLGMTANGGTDASPVGDALAAAALQAAGVPAGRALACARRGGAFTAFTRGWRVQVIWKSDIGGNHFDHVHVGLAPSSGRGSSC
jgi:hypothetical protein